MNIISRLLLLISVMSACDSAEDKKSADMKRSFNDFLDAYYEERLSYFPIEATQIGDNRYNHLLPNDISEAFRSDIGKFYQQYQAELNSYNRDSLDAQEQVSYDIFKREMEINLRALKFNDHYIPVHQFWGMTLTIPQIASGKSYQPFKTAKDYDDFLKRIDGFAIWVDTAIVNMRKGLSIGYTYPKILMERVLPQAQDMMVSEVTKSIFWEPIVNMPDSISEADKSRLTNAYASAIQNKVVPTYKKLHDFLRNEYIPRTRTSSGFSDLPGGKEHYEHLVNFWTTTTLTPEEIFKIGESEVRRIRQEMEKIKTQVGFKGNLKAFFEHINNDKKFMPYKTAEDVL